MEREEACKTLPDELVETIISMLPYPSIFKARCLSKSWLARLSSISSEEDEGKKRLVTSFQKLVGERSNQWQTYCPVSISKDGGLIGYQQGSNKWQKMPSLSFLPENLLTTLLPQIEGALLLLFGGFYENGEIYVANILTRTSKRLPPLPITVFAIDAAKLVVVDKSLETYKVIVLSCENDIDFCSNFVQIYDSQSDSWTGKKFLEGSEYNLCSIGAIENFVDFNGISYVVVAFDTPKLWAFNVEEGAVEELELSISDDFDVFSESDYYCLVACKADLMMVYFTSCDNCFHVAKVDLQTLTLVPVAKSPPDGRNGKLTGSIVVNDGYSIYVDMHDMGVPRPQDVNNRILKYEVGTDTWSLLRDETLRARDWAYRGSSWTRHCLQPGLSAFMAV